MKTLIFTLSIALMSPSFSQAIPRLTAYVLDVSGSMDGEKFNQSKNGLIGAIRQIENDDIGFVIPFAENDREAIGADKTSKLMAEQDILDLKPDGQDTNLDEGVQAGIAKLTEESKRLSCDSAQTIVLISDAISSPGPYHKAMTIGQLASIVPDHIMFYVIDLSNNSYPGLSATEMGRFTGFTQPGINMTVFPVQDAANITGILSEIGKHTTDQVESQETVEPETPQPMPVQPATIQTTPQEKSGFSFPYYIMPIVLIAISLILWKIMHKQSSEDAREANDESENEMLSIEVDDVVKRFDTPVDITIGGGKTDDIIVEGARSRELVIHIGQDGKYFSQKKGSIGTDKGTIFRSRSFQVNGTQVYLKLESGDEPELHRYLGR